jgi:hypothetical protein
MVAGAVVYGLAATRYGALTAGDATLQDRTALAGALDEVSTGQNVALALLGAGAAVTASGATWALWPRPQLQLTAGGAAIALGWELR